MAAVIYKFLDNNIIGSTHKYNIPAAGSLDIVTQNKKLAIRNSGLSINHINTIKQVHGDKAIFIEADIDYDRVIAADALVTNKKNVTLAVMTADCVPILLKDENNQVIAAIHAGHKGAFCGVIENTVKMMHDKGASKISAYIGPCIKQNNYEVGEEFYRNFIDQGLANEKFFLLSKKKDHYFFDLTDYVKSLLNNLGVNIVHTEDIDTYSNQNYFSFRRYTHSNKTEEYGSNLSIISII